MLARRTVVVTRLPHRGIAGLEVSGQRGMASEPVEVTTSATRIVAVRGT
jgi:hypothetical protein